MTTEEQIADLTAKLAKVTETANLLATSKKEQEELALKTKAENEMRIKLEEEFKLKYKIDGTNKDDKKAVDDEIDDPEKAKANEVSKDIKPGATDPASKDANIGLAKGKTKLEGDKEPMTMADYIAGRKKY